MEIVASAEDLDRMPLLGLFMKAALEERAHAVKRARLRGEIAITTGEMSVTLDCSKDRVVVKPGATANPRAHLKSSLDSLVAIACGRLTEPVRRNDTRISGSPLALAPLLYVFRH